MAFHVAMMACLSLVMNNQYRQADTKEARLDFQ